MRIQQTLCTGLFNKMNENKKKKQKQHKRIMLSM